MARFIYLHLLVFVTVASSSQGASLTDSSTREVDPWENNPEYTESGLEIHGGDMLYPEDLINKLTDEARQAIDPDYYGISGRPECLRWPNATLSYYRNSTTMSDATFYMLRKAMDLWKAVSCLKFQSVGANYDKAYVKFTDTFGGCYAHVGSICWIPGYNELNLGPGCAYSVGTPAHELGHSFGVYHQQSRYDRDEYVVIKSENIQSGRGRNFDKKSEEDTDNFDVAYDYCSVMHYSRTAFTSNGQETIAHIDPSNNMNFGQRIGLSWGDIKLANRMYQCGKKCEDQNLRCPTGCIFYPHDCSKCMCGETTSRSTCTAYTTDNLPDMVPSLSTATTPKPMTTPKPATTAKPMTTFPPTTDTCDVLLRIGTLPQTHTYSVSNANKKKQNCIISVETVSPKNVRVQVTKYVFNPKAKKRKTCTQNYFQISEQGSLTDFTGKKKYCGKGGKKQRIAATSTGTGLTFNLNLAGNKQPILLQFTFFAV